MGDELTEQEIKYKIARAIAERQLTKQGINDSTDAIYKIFEEQKRELLLAYAKYHNEHFEYEKIYDTMIDKFLDQ